MYEGGAQKPPGGTLQLFSGHNYHVGESQHTDLLNAKYHASELTYKWMLLL